MRSKRNSSIITAYSLLFTVAIGIVAEDLWTGRQPDSKAARRSPVAKAANPAGPMVAQVKVATR